MHTSKADIYAESYYTYESPVSYGMTFWECFCEEEDFEEDDDPLILVDRYIDYDEVYDLLLENYINIVHQIFQEMDYKEIKTIIHKIQDLTGVYNEASFARIIDNGEKILEEYDDLKNIFKLADIVTKKCDMYWFNILYNIGLEYLYQNWFDDLVSKTAYVSQTIFIEPISLGLQAVGIDIDCQDLRENWKCYQKILKHIVPDDKKPVFSKACREKLMEYECLRNIYDI
jgi:hypothetical protein